MSEINFIQQNKKSDKKKEHEKSSKVEYTRPKEEEIDFLEDEKEKKSIFDSFGFIKAFRGDDTEKRRPIFSGDSANKELWKKVVKKKPSPPPAPSPPRPGTTSPPAPSPAAPHAKNSAGIFSFLKNIGGAPAAKTETRKTGGAAPNDREIEEIMLSKNLRDTKEPGKKTPEHEASDKIPAAASEGPDELDILQTNLIKDQSLGFVDWKHNLYPIIFSIAIPLLIILFGYGGIMYWGIKNIEQTKIDPAELLKLEQNIDTGMSRIKNEQVLLSEKKFPAVKYLIENHVYWTNFFDFLEKNTLQTVQYANFSGNTAGRYVLSAQAADVKSAAEQVKALKSNKWVMDSSTYGLSIGNSGADESGKTLTDKSVSFSLTLDIDPKLFKDYAANE